MPDRINTEYSYLKIITVLQEHLQESCCKMLWFWANSLIPNGLIQMPSGFKGKGLDQEKKQPVSWFPGQFLSLASYSWQQMSANQTLNMLLCHHAWHKKKPQHLQRFIYCLEGWEHHQPVLEDKNLMVKEAMGDILELIWGLPPALQGTDKQPSTQKEEES